MTKKAPDLENEDLGVSGFFRLLGAGIEVQVDQVSLLTLKNVLVSIRKWPSLLIRLIYPSVCILLFFFLLWNITEEIHDSIEESKEMYTIPMNIKPLDLPFPTIIYSPLDDPLVYSIMEQVSLLNNPQLTISDFGSDPLGYNIRGFHNYSEMADWTMQEDNWWSYLVGLSFDEDIVSSFNPKDPGNTSFPFNASNKQDLVSPLEYTIWGFPSFGDPFGSTSEQALDYTPQIQRAVEAATISVLLAQELNSTQPLSPTLEYGWRGLPAQISTSPANAVDSDVSVLWIQLGSPILYLSLFVFMVTVATTINFDRTNSLRLGMKMMGLLSFPYWFSLFIQEALLAAGGCGVLVLVGRLCQLQFFERVSPFVIFFMLWCSAICLIAFTMFILSAVHGTGLSVAIIIAFSLMGILLMELGSITGAYFGASPVWKVTSAMCFPCSWSKFVFLVNSKAMQPGSLAEDFVWSDLFEDYAIFGGEFNATQVEAELQPGADLDPYRLKPYVLLLYILMSAGIFWILAQYVDIVWPGEFGVPQGVFYFLTPSYWGLGGRSKSVVEVTAYDQDRLSSVLMSLDPDVNREFQSTMKSTADYRERHSGDADHSTLPAVQLLKVSKTYRKGGFCGCLSSTQDQRALDFLTLTGQHGTVLCILGHNGAGKTTAVNCLTGVTAPSFGDAFVYGKSIISNMTEVRKISGVCPQNNIIWPELTAKEHLMMFAKLKGVPFGECSKVAHQHLKEVDLLRWSSERVQNFSGGMKRRLSVAIATIGNPTIVFLDEPTSGLDPRNKRMIWTYIRQIKERASIVLTTHSMEEADALGDKIAIMALGRLRAVGTTVHLKNRFGLGYHLNLVCRRGKSEEVDKSVRELLPELILDASSAGNLSYSLPHARISDVTRFFKFVERQVDTFGDGEDEEEEGDDLEEKAKKGKKRKRKKGKKKSKKKAKADSGALISDWGISQTTIEEVFLRLTHGQQTTTTQQEGQAFYSGTKEEELHQLNVCVEGQDEPCGFVKVGDTATALELRSLIDGSIVDIPEASQYKMLLRGVEVSEQQELTLSATEFLPMIIIRPHETSQLSPTPFLLTSEDSDALEEDNLGPTVKQLQIELKSWQKQVGKKDNMISELQLQLTKEKDKVKSLQRKLNAADEEIVSFKKDTIFSKGEEEPNHQE